MKLDDHPCLVVGGGKIAFQKINQLLESRAQVTVIAPKISDKIQCLPVQLMKREYNYSDIKNKQLIIAATNNNQINKQIYKDAYRQGIPVNVVDQPHLCSFYMGSVYSDGDLKVAISTNGKCPSFGIFLRDHIQNISKGLWGISLDKLSIIRKKIIQTSSTYKDKKNMMGDIVSQKCKQIISKKKAKGKVVLVGAGPGDPELITAKGIRASCNITSAF
jgi:siroheme synthase-like protein